MSLLLRSQVVWQHRPRGLMGWAWQVDGMLQLIGTEALAEPLIDLILTLRVASDSHGCEVRPRVLDVVRLICSMSLLVPPTPMRWRLFVAGGFFGGGLCCLIHCSMAGPGSGSVRLRAAVRTWPSQMHGVRRVAAADGSACVGRIAALACSCCRGEQLGAVLQLQINRIWIEPIAVTHHL